MHDFGFFLGIAIVGALAYGLGEFLDHRRKARRARLVASRAPMGEELFLVSLAPQGRIEPAFARAARIAVARGLNIEAHALRPEDRLVRDLGCVNFDAMAVAASLEHALDMRVRVRDLFQARTLRELIARLHERTLEISDWDPPLHREPEPRATRPTEAGDAQAL
jgi:hypothetical protein